VPEPRIFIFGAVAQEIWILGDRSLPVGSRVEGSIVEGSKVEGLGQWRIQGGFVGFGRTPPSGRIPVWWLKTLELVVSEHFTKRHFTETVQCTQPDMATRT